MFTLAPVDTLTRLFSLENAIVAEIIIILKGTK